MKRRKIIIIAGIIILTWVLFYVSKMYIPNRVMAQDAAHDHSGHISPPRESTGNAAEQEDTDEETPMVEISPESRQLIGVKTMEVSVRPLQKVIRTVGRIEYDERKLVTINTKFEGWIEKLYVDYTGRYVKKGEPLADIYSPELVATQQELISALKWAKQSTEHRPVLSKAEGTQNTEIKNENNPPSPPFDKGGMGGFSDAPLNNMFSDDAEKIVDSARQRLNLWDITDEQIKKIEETGKPIKTLTLFSPISGYVIQKMALQGMRVMPGEKLFDIADLSTVWVISDIYEFDLPLIKVGQTAKISLSYFPGKDFSSTIAYIYPALAGETRTARVRFTIPNSSAQLKPQMFTNVEIKVDMGKRLAIPNDAVIDTGTRQIVYVDKGEGNFEPREVVLGLKADGMTEVISGLESGEKVASSATFLIDSEAQLKGVKPIKRE